MPATNEAPATADGAAAERLFEAARVLVPRIRDQARAMEQAGRLDDDLVEAMDAAGLFSVVVPKFWGGAGLGPRELNTVVEIVATGDCSTAWVNGFFNLHNWFLFRFPMEVQTALYADRASVRCAAVFNPPGTAERVHGGYEVTGRWGYATGILHASHALVPAMVDGAFFWLIVARDDLETSDDWDVASMVATGSVTIATHRVFVPEAHGLPFTVLMSATDHPGAVHEEEVY